MKLEKILDELNSFEKNAFLKIIDGIISDSPKNIKKIEEILTDSNRNLKNVDNNNIVQVFNLIESEFANYLQAEFSKTTSQFDILIDIISRDGNCIMKQDWFGKLYENEIRNFKQKIKAFEKNIESEKSEFDESRVRDFKVYKACLYTAYHNDEQNNQECKITVDEQDILNTLSRQLGLSKEEVKLINYIIIPVKKLDNETIINDLRSIGVLFFSRKLNTIYVPDEIVRILRKIRGKEIADKFFRRILRLMREPQINLICRKHNIDKKLPLDDKVRKIINDGIRLSSVLTNDIYKNGTNLNDKKKFINELCSKGLKIQHPIGGSTIEDKIDNLVKYFEEIEKDDKVAISVDGYEKLLVDLGKFLPELNQQMKIEFELQEDNVLKSKYLLAYNIKPIDVLEIMTDSAILDFCKTKDIKTRGNLIYNILGRYKDADNLYLENFENIGFRNYNALKENGIDIKEHELGVKFEEITKNIFRKLGFNVDERLRKKLNTSKDKIDIVINLSNSELIIIECKTVKESGYNKFSYVTRQLKAYSALAEKNNFKVIKSLLVAPDYSDDFVNECGLDYEINLSLITASTLLAILEGFKNSKLKQLPHNLLMKDVLIQEDRILKAISK